MQSAQKRFKDVKTQTARVKGLCTIVFFAWNPQKRAQRHASSRTILRKSTGTTGCPVMVRLGSQLVRPDSLSFMKKSCNVEFSMSRWSDGKVFWLGFCLAIWITEQCTACGHGTFWNRGPLFCWLDGTPISRTFFVERLNAALKFCNLDTSLYKAHSFRIAAASWAYAKGFSDSQIRILGHWTSTAFLRYIRTPSIKTRLGNSCNWKLRQALCFH